MEQTLFLRNAGLERLEWSGCQAGESGRGPASHLVRGPNSAEACAWGAGSAVQAAPAMIACPRLSAGVGSVSWGLAARLGAKRPFQSSRVAASSLDA